MKRLFFAALLSLLLVGSANAAVFSIAAQVRDFSGTIISAGTVAANEALSSATLTLPDATVLNATIIPGSQNTLIFPTVSGNDHGIVAGASVVVSVTTASSLTASALFVCQQQSGFILCF